MGSRRVLSGGAALGSCLLALAASDVALAGEPASAETRYPRIAAQVDAGPFALRGYSTWLGLGAAPHWNVALGLMAGDIPPFGLPEGWEGRIRAGNMMAVQYYFDAANEGVYVALHAGRFSFEYERPDTPDVTDGIDQVLVIPAAGYRWFPAGGFFVAPFAGVALPLFTHGEATIGGKTFEPDLPVSPIGGLYLGWEFGR